jgi:vacuolar-type H+-ATPase subunit E/Vma4
VTHDRHLDALDDALRRAVDRHGEEALAAARGDADVRVADARHRRDQLIAHAEAEGRAAADELLRRDRARVRRDAAAVVLAAKRAAHVAVRAHVGDAVGALRSAADYPDVLDALAARAAARLGEGTHAERDPPGGGVVATAGSRRIDYTLPALADRACDALGESIEAVWR